MTKSSQASLHPEMQNSFIPMICCSWTWAFSPSINEDNLFYWCFSPHFITIQWPSKGGSSERFYPSELHSPTPDSWNQTQHFPSLDILQGPQLHQRICLLSLNLSLSIQKPKNLPPNYRVVFSQLCLLKTLINRNINQILTVKKDISL